MDSGTGIGGHSKSILEMTTSKLDYESPFIVENGVTKSHEVIIRTQSNTENGPIEFHLQPDPEKYIDPTTFQLHGKVGLRVKHNNMWKPLSWSENLREFLRQLKEKDNNLEQLALTDAEEIKYGVVNNFFSSMISSLVCKLNDCEIGDTSTNSYPYLSYLQTLLGTSASQSGSEILSSQLFIKDAPENMEAPNTSISDTPYHKRRKVLFEREWVDFHIPIHSDLATCEKYLPPNSKLSFIFKRVDDEFSLWNAEGEEHQFHIVLDDLYVTLHKLEVTPKILKNHYDKYVKADNPLKIKFTENVLKTFAVPQHSFEMTHHNLFFGNHLPEKVYSVVVEQAAFNGDIRKNPFFFETAGIKEAYLTVNSVNEPNPPYQIIEGSEENSAYLKFLANTGTSLFEMESVNVSAADYKNGYFILAFDRSPTRDNGLYTHKTQGGSMSIKMKCKEETPKNYMVLVIASFEKALVFHGDKVFKESIY